LKKPLFVYEHSRHKICVIWEFFNLYNKPKVSYIWSLIFILKWNIFVFVSIKQRVVEIFVYFNHGYQLRYLSRVRDGFYPRIFTDADIFVIPYTVDNNNITLKNKWIFENKNKLKYKTSIRNQIKIYKTNLINLYYDRHIWW
jgi:hypothetical protein